MIDPFQSFSSLQNLLAGRADVEKVKIAPPAPSKPKQVTQLTEEEREKKRRWIAAQVTCTAKTQYTSKEARTVLNRIGKSRGKPLRAYHCPICNLYHLTKTESRDEISA